MSPERSPHPVENTTENGSSQAVCSVVRSVCSPRELGYYSPSQLRPWSWLPSQLFTGAQISHPPCDPQGSAFPDSAGDCGHHYRAVQHEPLQLPPSNFPLQAEPSCRPPTLSSPPGPPLPQLFPPHVPRSCHGVCASEDSVGQRNPQAFLRAASACDVETP